MSQLAQLIPYLTPYEKPFYFIILGVLFIPSILLSLNGKRMMWYQNFLTIFFLWLRLYLQLL